jgi:hypothetical protein
VRRLSSQTARLGLRNQRQAKREVRCSDVLLKVNATSPVSTVFKLILTQLRTQVQECAPVVPICRADVVMPQRRRQAPSNQASLARVPE